MTYRFETLLKIRKNREEVLKKEMGQIQTHLENQKRALEFMADLAEDRKKELNRNMEGDMNIDRMVLYQHFFSGVNNEKKRQQQVIAEIEGKFDGKRTELVEAMQKRRTLEILKEKDAAKQKQRELKKEIEILDETGARPWRRDA